MVTQSYKTPFTEHAFLEPECAVAFPYGDGVKVYTSDQGVYDTPIAKAPYVGVLVAVGPHGVGTGPLQHRPAQGGVSPGIEVDVAVQTGKDAVLVTRVSERICPGVYH